MKCAQCQIEMEPQERFCSKCGRDSQPVSRRNVFRDWDTHVKVLAWIFIVSATFMAIPGLSLLFFPGILMVGRIFPPFPIAGPFFVLIALVYLTIPAGIVCTGVGLLQYRNWGRVFALILSGLMLIAIPFGTAVGIYGFWVLNSIEGASNYKLRSAGAAMQSPATVQ